MFIKKRKKVLFCVLLIVGLFAGNLYAASKVNANTNVLTAVSGWVGFLATAGIGVLTLWRDAKYNESNSAIAEQERNILEHIETLSNQQHEHMVRNQYFNIFSEHYFMISTKFWELSKYDCNWANLYFAKMSMMKPDDVVDPTYHAEIGAAIDKVLNFQLLLGEDVFFFEKKGEILELCDSYKELIRLQMEEVFQEKFHKVENAVERYSENDRKLGSIWQELALAVEKYLLCVRIYSISLLNSEYDFSEIPKDLERMQNTYAQWLKEHSDGRNNESAIYANKT